MLPAPAVEAGSVAAQHARAPRPRVPSLVANLALSAASVLVCTGLLLAVEFGARLFAPSNADTNPDSVHDGHVYSEHLGWVPRPGAVFDVDGARTTINALGYRGRALKPDDGQHSKVVVLGDSVAFGYGVADHETFSELLDDWLPDVDLVNLAVPGYGIDQEVLRFEADGRPYRPALVLLNICLANDLVDVMLPSFLYGAQHPKPFFQLAEGRLVLQNEHLQLRRLQLVELRLREGSQAYRQLRGWLAPAGGDPDVGVSWVERRRRAMADESAARRLVVALIARLRAGVEQQGGKLTLVVHPTKETYRRGTSWWSALSAAPELAGLDVIDLSQSYHAAGLGFGRLALDELGHLNPNGHRLAALALRTEVASVGSLARSQLARE